MAQASGGQQTRGQMTGFKGITWESQLANLTDLVGGWLGNCGSWGSAVGSLRMTVPSLWGGCCVRGFILDWLSLQSLLDSVITSKGKVKTRMFFHDVLQKLKSQESQDCCHAHHCSLMKFSFL